VIATYSITPERLEVIDFAGPYYLSGTAIQVRAEDREEISGPEDLTGLKIVTQANSTGIQAAEENVPDYDASLVQTLPDNESCVAALKQGRAGAYVLDQGVLLGNSAADEDVVVVGEPFVDDPYGIGLSKETEGALDFCNTFLQEIIDSGSWEALWTATIGAVVDGEAPTPPTPGDLPDWSRGSHRGDPAASAERHRLHDRAAPARLRVRADRGHRPGGLPGEPHPAAALGGHGLRGDLPQHPAAE